MQKSLDNLTSTELSIELQTKSVRQIADEFDTYPNKIARLARKWGLTVPDRTEGQKRSFQNGRAVSPMAGKTHDQESKNKISQTRHNTWQIQKMGEDYDELIKRYRAGFKRKTAEQIEDMHKKAAKAVYATKKEGSKLERFIMEKLRDSGYSPEFHAQQVVLQEDLEVDIYLPELRLALEIDGVTHDENIYGAEHLARRRLADSKKNGLLLTNGFTIIRIPNKAKHVSKYFLNSTWAALEKEINRLREKESEPEVIQLEVN